MKSTQRLAYALALIVFLLDQGIKYIVLGPLDLTTRGQIVVTSFFNLTWVQNYGVSMGFLTAESDAMRWLLVGVTGLIAIGVAVWIWRERDRVESMALALILGGALGNIVDRARLGYVTDFADLHFGGFRPFLVFNVADAAISIGVFILILRAIFVRSPDDPPRPAPAPPRA